MDEPTVVADGLQKEYEDGFVAVEDISFDGADGEVIGIIGPNGAGKTTTLKMLAGLISPSDGTAQIAGHNIKDSEMRSNIGFLPEESPAYDAMTARSYLQFFADLYDIPRNVANERISSALDELSLEYRDRPIGDLSKGMTRKVLIARSLVNDPDVLIYDEPASGLDPYTTNYIIDYIAELANRGKTVVFSAHNLYHVESLCDRVLILDTGDIIARGTVSEVRSEHGSTQYDVVLSDPLPGAESTDDVYRKRVATPDAVEEVREQAANQDVNVIDTYTVEPSLEDIFLELIERDEL